jgi:hypothetical protein
MMAMSCGEQEDGARNQWKEVAAGTKCCTHDVNDNRDSNEVDVKYPTTYTHVHGCPPAHLAGPFAVAHSRYTYGRTTYDRLPLFETLTDYASTHGRQASNRTCCWGAVGSI